MSNKTHSLNNIFRENRKTFIIAMDHDSIFTVHLAVKHPGIILSEAASAGVGSVIATGFTGSK